MKTFLTEKITSSWGLLRSAHPRSPPIGHRVRVRHRPWVAVHSGGGCHHARAERWADRANRHLIVGRYGNRFGGRFQKRFREPFDLGFRKRFGEQFGERGRRDLQVDAHVLLSPTLSSSPSNSRIVGTNAAHHLRVPILKSFQRN